MSDYSFYDRDMSWLGFNYRVLLEARSPKVPILERLRFAAIYSSNLDEFFRVRVAHLRSIAEIDKKKINKAANLKEGLITEIHQEVSRQLTKYGEALDEILSELRKVNICFPDQVSDLKEDSQKELHTYFKTKVLAYLRPFISDFTKHEPFLNNQQLYLALRLKKGEDETFGYVNIPSDALPRFYLIKEEEKSFFVFLDDIIRANIDSVFKEYEVLECKSIKLNKDADLNIDDEYSGDLTKKIEKQIEKRNLGKPSRFLFDKSISDSLLSSLHDTFNLDDKDLVPGGKRHNLNDFFQVFNPTEKNIEYERQKPVGNKEVGESDSILSLIEKKDLLFHFPYQSYDYVLEFFNEAAVDPQVEEIYVTFYRMAKDSVIGEALISAANNGKKVIVFMELKARFDEANNIFWAKRLKKSGVEIVYSIPGLKVHAKVALVRKKIGGTYWSYGFFGTGNLNEKTAKIYCDHGLLSSDREMTDELLKVFQFLHKKEKPEAFKNLLVSQFNAVDGFTALIDQEIANKKAGKKAHIIIKLNNLEEKGMIEKLYEAAEAGVKVELLARSICCLVPETAGIPVTRLVDRYLEHARVFYFWNDGEETVYMGSSDWMSRNLFRRVEVCFPIKNESLKKQVMDIVHLQLNDNTNSVRLDENLNNIPVENSGEKINAQSSTYELVKEWNS
ncbi:MAG: polyphosphate kinase 1 [Bacteroidota bacterium]